MDTQKEAAVGRGKSMKVEAPDAMDGIYNYSVDESEREVQVTIRRKGTTVAVVTIGQREGEENSHPRLLIRRFDPNEFQERVEIDEPSN